MAASRKLKKLTFDRIEKLRTVVDDLREMAWNESMYVQDERAASALQTIADRLLEAKAEDDEMAELGKAMAKAGRN